MEIKEMEKDSERKRAIDTQIDRQIEREREIDIYIYIERERNRESISKNSNNCSSNGNNRSISISSSNKSNGSNNNNTSERKRSRSSKNSSRSSNANLYSIKQPVERASNIVPSAPTAAPSNIPLQFSDSSSCFPPPRCIQSDTSIGLRGTTIDLEAPVASNAAPLEIPVNFLF